MANARPCGTCRHLDGRLTGTGAAYCWQFYAWRMPDQVVTDCDKAERADGKAPPGRISFEGERS